MEKGGIRTLTKVIPGGVQVGDDFSKVSNLKLINNGENERGETWYQYYYLNYEDALVGIYVKNNIITSISFAITD